MLRAANRCTSVHGSGLSHGDGNGPMGSVPARPPVGLTIRLALLRMALEIGDASRRPAQNLSCSDGGPRPVPDGSGYLTVAALCGTSAPAAACGVDRRGPRLAGRFESVRVARRRSACGRRVAIARTPRAPELRSSRHLDHARDCMGGARADIVRRGDRRRDLASAS
jgi:hypothetical protein